MARNAEAAKTHTDREVFELREKLDEGTNELKELIATLNEKLGEHGKTLEEQALTAQDHGNDIKAIHERCGGIEERLTESSNSIK